MEDKTKGDWFQSLKKDFEFIKVDMNEDSISQTPKSVYKKTIWSLVKKAAFEYFMNLKKTHTKLDNLTYTQLKPQAYMSSTHITQKQKELLYVLRSTCYGVKNNFKKLYKNDLTCRFGCTQNEDQYHAFTQCQPILHKLKYLGIIQYNDIFGSTHEQINTIGKLYNIDQLRNHILKKHISPGGQDCQDPCTFGYTLIGAADFISC